MMFRIQDLGTYAAQFQNSCVIAQLARCARNFPLQVSVHGHPKDHEIELALLESIASLADVRRRDYVKPLILQHHMASYAKGIIV